MDLQMEPMTTEAKRKELRKHLAVAACGAALTVAALAGIGAWQAKADSRTTRVGDLPSSASHGRTGSATAAPAPVTSASGARLASPSQRFTYYVAGSQEQADLAELGLQAELTSIADSPAGAPSGYTVAVVSSPAEETQLRQAVADADAFAAAYGVEGPQLEDLRTP